MEKLSYYIKKEIVPLIFVTVFGIIYNAGLSAGVYFEGQLVQKLFDIVSRKAVFSDMLVLALVYVSVILVVQGSRCLKRFYVRRFANDISRQMRHMLYHHLVFQKKAVLDQESTGSLMTKAVADVDACAEGMRKFTTEVFDTGVALAAYFVMMLYYDWRLTLISCIFAPTAYLIAERLKVYVYKYQAKYKKCAGVLNDVTMERISGAMTYRLTGREADRDADYEKHLKHYEKTAVMANIWENSLQPIYHIIAMTGVVFVLYFGARNVLGTGWCTWNIAAFTSYMFCFAKAGLRSAKVAKLFNAVQKAQVSFRRIKPLIQEGTANTETNTEMKTETITEAASKAASQTYLDISQLAFSYDGSNRVFRDLSFKAKQGEIIGVTGTVACGKSTFGKVFLCEAPYEGSVLVNGKELCTYTDEERNSLISYMGHQLELMSDTIHQNICYGEEKDVWQSLLTVCLDQEISGMSDGIDTQIGAGGVRLSGGQQARLALARTIYHKRKILVLDDPFSAVDSETEHQIVKRLREQAKDTVIIVISHRITMFPLFDQVIFMENGRVHVGTHEEIMNTEQGYTEIFRTQQFGGDLDEK